MKPHGLPRRHRLRRRREFLRVQNTGRRRHTRHFLVFSMAHEGGDGPRLGITVTRKVGPAVVRNRIKRLVREAFRRERGRFRADLDIVFVAKRGAATVGYAEVLREVLGVATGASLAAEQADLVGG